jgi:DNA-binding PadR family transcriptional regulator
VTGPYIGEFEQMVLLAVLQLGDGAYGPAIRSLIERRARRTVARGALYTALERLEAKGCLRSRMGDPTPERGGRARRYFTVSAEGLRALRASRTAMARLAEGLESALERS